MSLHTMPVNVGDLLRDTQGLNAEEFGAYHALLYALWGNRGELVFDVKALARIARVSARRWPTIWDKLAIYFEMDQGTIRQKRVTKTLQKVAQKVEANRANGKRGGERKALKDKERALATAKATAMADAKANAIANGGANQNQTLLTERDSEEDKSSSGAEAPQTLSDADYLWAVGAKWLEDRGHSHARSFLGRQRKLISDDAALCRIIDNAIQANPGDALEYLSKAVQKHKAQPKSTPGEAAQTREVVYDDAGNPTGVRDLLTGLTTPVGRAA